MPNIVYSVDERVEMVSQHEQGMSYRRISDHFADKHPNRPIPSHSTIKGMVKKFRKTGNLDFHKVRFYQPSRQLSEEMKFAIRTKAEEDPNKSAAIIAQELLVSRSSVRHVLKAAKLGYYKSKKHEEPSLPADEENHTTYSQNLIDTLKTDESSLRRVCFSNETTILYVSKSEKQNVLLCSWRIQHLLINQSEMEYQKLHVWTGAVGNKPIGPFFIMEDLNGETYLNLLREKIVPALKAIDEDGPVIWYQRDGVPPYYTAQVFAYLNQEFSGRWIGRESRVQRLTCALDMTLLDQALSGRLKNILYAGEKIENLSVLQTKVSEIIGSMDPQTVCNTIRAHYSRSLRGRNDVGK